MPPGTGKSHLAVALGIPTVEGPKSVCLTTRELLGDPVGATALLDRLLHHAVVIRIEGASYRMREHQDTPAGRFARIAPPAFSVFRVCVERQGKNGQNAGFTSPQPTIYSSKSIV